jgi:putative hydroxymethylpyrimidine transport system ATP-binding protein
MALSAAAPLSSSIEVLVDKLSFGFGCALPLFQDFTVRLTPGLTAFLGASGVGKSTLLRLVAGRLSPLSGRIARKSTHRLAWMGQTGGLLPWADALDNVCIGARLRGERVDRKQAQRLLARMGLTDHVDKRPAELSGGMQQRVSLARTLMEDASVALLDEPFAHMDAKTKAELYALVTQELGNRVVVMVTHDPIEALTIADRIVVLAKQPSQIVLDIEVPSRGPRDARDPDLDAIFRQLFAALDIR